MSHLSESVAGWTGDKFVTCAGDSIMAGYPTYTSPDEVGGPTGDLQADIATRLYGASGDLIIASNHGVSGATINPYIQEVIAGAVPDELPKYAVVEGGINSISGGHDFAYAEDSYDLIVDTCDTYGAILIVEEVYPSGLATPTEIADYNAALSDWVDAKVALGKAVHLLPMYIPMGDPDNPDSLLPAYTVDGTHLSADGVGQHAFLIVEKIKELEGDFTQRLRSAYSPKHSINAPV